MEQGKRRTEMTFFVSESELNQIKARKDSLGIRNMSAYLRKMAIDGYILKLDLPQIQEVISLLRRMGNNLNQLTKRVNAGGHLYESELQDIQHDQKQLWDVLNMILAMMNMLP